GERSRTDRDRDPLDVVERQRRPREHLVDERRERGGVRARFPVLALGEDRPVPRHADGRRPGRRVETENDQDSQSFSSRWMSLYDTKTISVTSRRSPTCIASSRWRRWSGRRITPSTAKKARCPPSSIGTGSRFRTARFTESSASVARK